MTRKERVRAALAHEETDLVPYQMDCLSAAERKLKDFFGEQDLGEVIARATWSRSRR